MTPYEELTDGNPMGPSMYALLVKLTRSMGRGRPAPSGHTHWSDEAARQWLHDYFFPTKGERVGLKMLLTAVDDESLVRVARKSIQRAFIDQTRATTAGRMVARLETLLPREGFIDARGIYAGTWGWTLPEFGDAIYHGDWKDLLRHPSLKGIPPIQSLPTQGTTSRANVASIVRAVRGLLVAAGGAMSAREIANAVVTVFDLDEPSFLALRDEDQEPSSDEDEEGSDGDRHVSADQLRKATTEEFADLAHIREDADRIWNALTIEERRLVGVLEEPVALWNVVVPGRSDVAALGGALKTKLQATLTAEPVAAGTLEVIVSRSLNLPR